MWILFIAIVLGFILFKLGVLSVLVVVLSMAFKAAVVLIAGMGLLILYLQHRK